MSKPRYGWWPYVKSMIRRYPALKEQHDNLLRMQITPSYSGMAGGGGDGRGLENTVIRAMSQNETREYEAVEAALAELEMRRDGADMRRLIEMVYWNRTHTIAGAAMDIHVSEITALRWNRDLIYTVAKHYGLFP